MRLACLFNIAYSLQASLPVPPAPQKLWHYYYGTIIIIIKCIIIIIIIITTYGIKSEGHMGIFLPPPHRFAATGTYSCMVDNSTYDGGSAGSIRG